MQVFKTHLALREALGTSFSGKSIGLVPTMGALHRAHLSLVERALQDNDVVVVSIFVNPTQFNNTEDLVNYPRDLEGDVALLKGFGVQAVYAPSVEDVYGSEVEADEIDLGSLASSMEGEYRPGHFEGVATIVRRLLELIRPTRAYFGEKDFQQVLVVEKVAEKLSFPLEIVPCPTLRNDQGLALSSRNRRLSDKGLTDALLIFQSMQWASSHWKDYSPSELKDHIRKRFAASPLDLEYVEIVDGETMEPIEGFQNVKSSRIFMAAYCEGVRLIDNDKIF